MESLFTSLLEQIHNWGAFAYAVMFLVAFLESFALSGLFIPGTLVMVFIGFIASHGVFDLIPLIAVTFLGAVCGDIASFYLGAKKGKWAVSILSRFSKKTDYIKVGENFFEKYGNKSVFIGRFIAIIRPFIPFVAGIFKMNWKPFLFWNVLGALIWSSLYILVGYFFGYAWKSAAVWISRASLLALIAILFIFLTRLVRRKAIESSNKDTK